VGYMIRFARRFKGIRRQITSKFLQRLSIWKIKKVSLAARQHFDHGNCTKVGEPLVSSNGDSAVTNQSYHPQKTVTVR